MRIAFDDQIFCFQQYGGASRVFARLAEQLATLGHDVTPSIERPIWSNNEYLNNSGAGRQPPRPLGRPGPAHLLNLTRPRGAVDILHHTYYHPAFLRTGHSTARVVTVLDMTPELFPGLFPRGNPHRAKELFVRRADLVLCISESTRQDLERLYGTLDAPVRVTRLGVDPVFRPGVSRPPGLPDEYVLFVGNRSGYKDFEVLVKALSEAAVGETPLVAVGGGPLTVAERDLIAQYGLTDRVAQTSLTDDELAGAYAHALCFVFPSRYEGFGLPTLEAMACGCPVLLAHSSSHLEVGGEVARYFEPGDVARLAALLEESHGDPVARERAGAAGQAHAAGFTWAQTARTTVDAYQMVV